ncbi:Hypothetical protein A7982_09550 [Minicystis rosea]|nr:Hypothetical protein A7982_09550 [Minicystis rosea]
MIHPSSKPASCVALAAVSALAACTPATSPLPPTSVEIAAASSEPPHPPPPPAPVAQPQPESEVLVAPSPVGCEIAGSRTITQLDNDISFCLAVEGPCFGHAADGTARLTATYFEGSARSAGVHITLDQGSFVVRGITKTGDVKLYPRTVFALGPESRSAELVIPIARVLEIESASRGRATVALPLGAGVALPGGVARSERRCDDLSIEATNITADEARRLIGAKAGPTPTKGLLDTLPTGKDTPLSTTPGLPPVAVLHPDEPSFANVDVIERRGRDARIFWERDGYAVFGWVPASALNHSHTTAMFGILGGLAGSGGGQPPAWRTCRVELPLFVEIASRRVEVGRIRKDGKLMPHGQRKSGFVPVDLSAAPVQLEAGAAWVVREANFDENCSP